MSADVLRRAAALMRERAHLRMPSYWSASFVREAFEAHPHVDMDAAGVPDTILRGSEHIASWHPAVALAVADWLDHAGEVAEEVESAGLTPGGPQLRPAHAVARAYLGESA